MKIGDIVQYTGQWTGGMTNGQRGQVIEIYPAGMVGVRTFTADGRTAGEGGVPVSLLRVVSCPETERLAVLAKAHEDELHARVEALSRLYREREQEAVAVTAKLCDCAPELVARIVMTYRQNFNDPTP